MSGRPEQFFSFSRSSGQCAGAKLAHSAEFTMSVAERTSLFFQMLLKFTLHCFVMLTDYAQPADEEQIWRIQQVRYAKTGCLLCPGQQHPKYDTVCAT